MTKATPESKPGMAEDSQGQPIPVQVGKNEEPVRVTDRRFSAQNESANETPASDYSFKPSYVEELEKKLAESQRKTEEVLASYREYKAETAAETQRARERIQNEYNRRLAQAKSDVVKKFVDILENLERALAAAKDKQAFDSLLEGVELIRNQFLATLAELGVSELEVAGRLFDPEIAEAVGTIDVSNKEQDQQVIEVVSKGYALDHTLIRPARVRVGRCVPTAGETSPA
ncbi:MAG: nucleotide exchange factor GrpE [Acidobacteria bacterium]|nr:nucleotide exchange factor GrpE [Acidobacteriota bacterium]MCI0718348.1 nucleotide exchange factor GrpE [Acidobacteriota bacterium]